MTLIILDPNLAHPHGHHMEFDLAIAAAARDREQDVLVFAHRDCPIGSKEGIEIVPLFSHTTYEYRSKDPIVGSFDNFTYFNDTLASELALIPRDRLRTADAVLVPTLTENHLLGYISWMRTFDAARAPLFVLYLMFPSGLGVPNKAGIRTVADPFQALFYRLAFRRASEPGPPIHFFGGGRQLAREFSDLAGSKIEAHPIPFDPRSRNSKRGTGRPAALLYAGDIKADKGFMFVPELADRLCTAWPDWDFLIHANSGSFGGSVLAAYNELKMVVAPRHKNLVLKTGRLLREDYLDLMDRAECLVSTYDPIVYARKSSGVIWEAISLGLPMLVPADTWLEHEAREWDAAYKSYNDFSVDGIIKSFGDFAEAVPTLTAQCLEAAERYQGHNGVTALMDQIGCLWAPRMLATSLTRVPGTAFITLEDIEHMGWSYPETLDGAIVRWVGKSFEFSFSWPFDISWRIEITVASCMGEEQITLARAFTDEQELATSTKVNAARKSGSITISGAGDRRSPAVQVRVDLPWVFTPPGENRSLGLLVRSIRVSPGETAERIEKAAQLEVSTRVTKTETGDFLLDRVVSGRAQMNPHVDNWLHFTVRTNGGPEAARAMEVYVNGIPMRVEGSAIGMNSWSMKVKCGPDILAAIGYWVDWDLVSRTGPESQVWIADLLVSESREGPALASTQFKDQSLAAEESIRIAQQPGALSSIDGNGQKYPSFGDEADGSRRQDRKVIITAKALPDRSGGFHNLEHTTNGTAFRWTGPGPESRFTLRVDRTRPVLLKFRILSLGKNGRADLTVEVDNETYPLREGESHHDVFVAGPLRIRSDNDPTEVRLRVSKLLVPRQEGSADPRILGVALGWIQAETAETIVSAPDVHASNVITPAQ
jgi:hypothetical protein